MMTGPMVIWGSWGMKGWEMVAREAKKTLWRSFVVTENQGKHNRHPLNFRGLAAWILLSFTPI
jgi:hypothetical protein